MGLAGPKKRAKLSHDPNNTAWSRNTESFGHKILSSQGWAPGDTLGAKDAAHSSHYTAGSNSHIRVLLKDDQLGLGAKRTGNNAETFGLSLFSGILGRLNGKSEVVLEKEQAAQRDIELALYTSRKGCYVNFVSAGFLVGDRIENAELLKKDEMRKKGVSVSTPEPTNKAVEAESDAQGTKRKRPETEAAAEEAEDSSSDSDSSSSEDKEPATSKSTKSKKSKKSADRVKANKSTKSKKDSAVEDDDDSSSSSAAADKQKKNKKAKKDKKSKSATNSENDERAAKKARKAARAEKRVEKDERRKQKEAKRAAKSASATPSTITTTTTTTPAEPVSGSVTPQAMPFIGRHAVRQRYIAAKGRAHLDPQALKEIFMVKA